MDDLPIPRSELSTLLILLGLVAKVVSFFLAQIVNIYLLGYSTCVIGALDKVATSFNTYVHCRLSDIGNLLRTMLNFANFRLLKHIPSKENKSDLATRSETFLSCFCRHCIVLAGISIV